jgi:nucleoside phosphorylase/CheY-like chemotaxis protein
MLSLILVEDSPVKARAIIGVLDRVKEQAPHSIEVVNNARDAKLRLKVTKYDLMILDLALPPTPEADPSPNGGVRLLEELRDRDNYLVPREVIGLTAYQELVEGTAELFARDVWSIIHYDPSSEAWADQIGRKVLHLSLASLSTTPLAFRSFLCVVTALSEPELAAVIRLPWNWRRHFSENDVTEYHAGCVKVREEEREVFAAAAPRMGMANAAALAAKMCELFRPRYLAIVGIAAGMRSRTEIGDIIVADSSWDWGSGKYAVVNGTPEFLSSPYQIGLHSSLRVRLEMMSRDTQAIDQIRHDWVGQKPNTALSMKIGAVASGATVLADESRIEAINRQHRKLLAVEMETYGVYSAAADSRLPQPLAFSMKSVCDFADQAKSDDHQLYAAHTSAAALKVFVERYL